MHNLPFVNKWLTPALTGKAEKTLDENPTQG
jgi:hypothetical protein